MQKDFYRVELRPDDPKKKSDLFLLSVPLDASGRLDPDGEGPPYRFEAVWDGEDYTGEFKERANQKQNVLVWSGVENGECSTDLLKAPLQIDRLISVAASIGGQRLYRVTRISKV
jgi:hypothetical protein